MFVLVRHCHAGDKQQWRGEDSLRPISGRGQQQAEGLAVMLTGTAPSRLVSSPYLRCRQSLAPLAERIPLPVEASDLLGPDTDLAELDRWLERPDLDHAVLCTHGETLTTLFDRWGATRRFVKTGDGYRRNSTQKGAAWIVTPDSDGTRARYLRPLHIGLAETNGR